MTLSPTLPVQSLAVFWQLLNQQQFAAAQQQLQQLLQQHPDFAPAWYGAAVLASRQRNNTQALHHLTKALELDDDNMQFLLFKIRLLISLGSQQAAKKLALTLAQGTYAQTEICADLALLLNSLKLHKHALDYYQQAHNLAPMDAGILFNLASLQRYMGQLTEAEANLDKAIELKPSDSEAWLLRSSLRKQTADDNHVDAIQQQIQQGSQQTAGDVLSSVQLHYALGKEYEDLQQYPACFSALNQGATLRRRNMQYNVQNDIATIDKIIEVFTPQVFTDKPACHNSQQPIFILGLPRTGSTMVERIIGGHSDVLSLGELNNFALEMMALLKSSHSKPPANKLDLVAMSRDIDFAKLGENYLKSVQNELGGHQHFIDKLPLNSLYVGLIHLALPQAKIIYIQRHPLDTCFAIYKQLFTNGYPFSYDLDDLAQYQIAHQRLMQHWQRVLPGVIHRVNYEHLVADVDTQTHKLLNYCGLEWQASCSQFQYNSAPSTTASAAQVRQGVYSSSIGKWRHFATQLAGVKQRLEQAGIACD